MSNRKKCPDFYAEFSVPVGKQCAGRCSIQTNVHTTNSSAFVTNRITDKILGSLLPKQDRLITPALQFHTAHWTKPSPVILTSDRKRNEDCFVIRFKVPKVSINLLPQELFFYF